MVPVIDEASDSFGLGWVLGFSPLRCSTNSCFPILRFATRTVDPLVCTAATAPNSCGEGTAFCPALKGLISLCPLHNRHTEKYISPDEILSGEEKE